MTGDVYDRGATADRIHEVQLALVGDWLKVNRVRPKSLDTVTAVEMVKRCSEELILPPGHLATVFRRMGWDAVAVAYLAHAKDAAKEKRKRAGNPGEQLRARVDDNEGRIRKLHAIKAKRGG